MAYMDRRELEGGNIMLQHDGRRFKLYPWKAKYKNTHGQQKEKWALPSREWWTSSADRQGFDVEFEKVELTEEQQGRYEQVRRVDMPEQFRGVCMDYILECEFPEGFFHPLDGIQTKTDISNMIPIELKTDKQQLETDGTDTATITGEIPTDFEKVHVIVNAPPPVYEEINDGEIEIEFTTEDEGFHVIEVTAGNHRGLIVIEGVNTSG